MTYKEAIGRIFDYKGRRFYVVRSLFTYARVIDLETSSEVFIYCNAMNCPIPPEWKEILP